MSVYPRAKASVQCRARASLVPNYIMYSAGGGGLMYPLPRRENSLVVKRGNEFSRANFIAGARKLSSLSKGDATLFHELS